MADRSPEAQMCQAANRNDFADVFEGKALHPRLEQVQIKLPGKC